MDKDDQAPEPPTAASVDPLIGKVLNGKFRVVGLVGRGGMGKIYKAEQLSLGRMVAKRSVIPLCAMRVTRDSDGGEIKPFDPASKQLSSCSCYYTERATGLVPPPGCTTCSTQTDCPMAAPNCNKFALQTKGYCEP